MLLIWISKNPARSDESRMGAIMQINKIIETSVGADLSALIRINRTIRRGDLDGRPWVGRADRSFRPQQGTGPHSQPRRVTIKVTPTDHPASCLSSWLRLMPITADSSALGGYSNIRILVLNAIIVPPK